MVFTTAATIPKPLNKFAEKMIFAVNTIGKKPNFPFKLQQYCLSETNLKSEDFVIFFFHSLQNCGTLFASQAETSCSATLLFNLTLSFTCCLTLTHCSSSGSSPPYLCSPFPSAAMLFKLISLLKVPF